MLQVVPTYEEIWVERLYVVPIAGLRTMRVEIWWPHSQRALLMKRVKSTLSNAVPREPSALVL